MTPAPLERQIHKGIAALLKLNASPGVVWTHIANERRCSPREGAFLKALGVRAGVPDFLILVGGQSPITYFLEVKTPKGRLSTEQKRFQADVEKIGIVYAIARSIDEAHRYFKVWGAVRSNGVRAAA
jgi:uncharacterized SAM-binding protein YcdF (DUF218 family)